MPTTKLGLPTITGNQTADVVRDLNALAEAVDEKAGVASGLATLGTDGKVPSTQLSVQEPADASLTVKGITKLNSATDSVSETDAATPKAVKAANDNANSRISTSLINQPNGVLGLGADGKPPADKVPGALVKIGEIDFATNNATTAEFTAIPLLSYAELRAIEIGGASGAAPTLQYNGIATTTYRDLIASGSTVASVTTSASIRLGGSVLLKTFVAEIHADVPGFPLISYSGASITTGVLPGQAVLNSIKLLHNNVIFTTGKLELWGVLK